MSGRAHEAGALHQEIGHRGPEWLRPPADVNALLPRLWSRSVARGDDGELAVAGHRVSALAAEFGTPLFVLDVADFTARCRDFAEAFADADVFYAGKAFLSRAVARWVDECGLHLDVCTGGELAVALSAGFPPARLGLHGNNKSTNELARAVDAGVGRIIVDSFHEIERLTALARERGVRQRVLLRVTCGVEAHTHEFIATAHEDQKFGLSLASGAALEAALRILDDGVLELAGLHSHIGSQIFDASGFEVAARRILGLQAQIRDARGAELPELDLGGGFGIAYTSQDDPAPAKELAERLRSIVTDECRARGLREPRLSIEPGRALIGPAMLTLYGVGTVKDVDGLRTYVSVDGGMSDNIRTALYGASYSATLASRRSTAGPLLTRIVGKHCESGDIVVQDEFLPTDIRPGDLVAVPGTGAYCRSMASNYNHVPRAAVVAVDEAGARLIVRRETEEDLLRLDVG
ncbi:diaminopimelate decarboxylase [Pilimelia anulata]|uniref:Diaminopimelate decarboxylase n=1 Tax=Pilimelia anulata TaxID=53371 RepID=A0A8J3B582_9ACTN|nr:diaminopimelate decarboxylase [Pilimelia anulata]GGJ83263.1 diaminopimelate decarboxylase [Pilimelia anulata]